MIKAITFLLVVFSWNLLAFSQKEYYPYVITNNTGTCYFKIVPQKGGVYGKGQLFRVSENEDKVLWSTNGWFSDATFLSWDADYLVSVWRGAFQSNNVGIEPVISIFRKGTLVRSFNVNDLYKNTDILKFKQCEVLSYNFVDKIIGFKKSYSYEFGIITVDNRELWFNVKNGKLLTSK